MSVTSKKIPLTSKSDPARSGIVSDERLINYYPEKATSSATDGFYLTRTPGLSAFTTIDAGPCRGLIEVEGEVIAVHSQSCYRIKSDGSVVYVGAVPGSDPVIMSANDAAIDGLPVPQVAIVCNAGTWIYRYGGLSNLYLPEFPNPNSAEYVDGYMIYTLADGRFIWSALSEAKTVDALDFATAEGDPDGLLRCLKVRRELYMMGPKSIEVWTHTAEADAPFQRVPGAVINVGLIGTHAACVLAGQLYWVDSHRIVRSLGSGYQATVISSDGLTRALSRVSNTDTIKMFGYVESGHQFVVLTCADFTWVFDASLGQWHERQSYNRKDWQASAYARAFGKHIIGSNVSGTIFYLDDSAAKEGSDHLVTTARLPTVSGFPLGAAIHRVRVNVDTGVGVLNGASEDEEPELMLRWSIDGGKTFVGYKTAKLGRLGKRNTDVLFTGLGSMKSQGIVFEFSCSAAVVSNLISVHMSASPRK